MPWVPDIITDLAQRLTVGEGLMLLGMFAVMAGALVLPRLKARSEREFRRRDDEFRRLQNM